MTQFKNFIGGEWVDGNDSAPNVNPSDTSDVIGHFARASGSDTESNRVCTLSLSHMVAQHPTTAL
jgi:hypothetical protein